MRQEFRCTLGKVVISSQVAEAETQEGKVTKIHSDSPPRVTHIHCQHMADYIKLFMEHGERLTLGEDWATPLITEVHSYYFCCPNIFTDIYAFILHPINFDTHLSIDITKNTLGQSHPENGRFATFRCHPTVSSHTYGFLAMQVMDLLAGR